MKQIMNQKTLLILLNTQPSNHAFFKSNVCYMSVYNLYETYVSHLRTRKLEKNSNQMLERHHVRPLHSTKIKRYSLEDKKEEKLLVTHDEHFLCHYYRYLTFREKGDFLCLQLRINVDANKAALCRQLGGFIAGNMNTPAQQKQRKRDLKKHPENLNPAKAGSVNSSKQRLHSQYLGKTYGKKAGMSRQHPVTKDRIQRPMLWIHQTGIEVLISKAETLQEIVEILNTHVPDNLTYSSALSNIIRGVERRRNGWTLAPEDDKH